jgi:hypothetical protein
MASASDRRGRSEYGHPQGHKYLSTLAEMAEDVN